MRALLFALTLMAPSAATAAELVMAEEKWCSWCARWNEEIGVIYAKTEEGKRAPLRRIDIHERLPEDLNFASRIHYTPTFVLFDNGQEVGRIEGYPGEDFFWGLLNRLLDDLPAPPADTTDLERRDGAALN
jgi:thioredoxin-related protein